MKLLWILEPTDDASLLEMLGFMRELNMVPRWGWVSRGHLATDEDWLRWFKVNNYKGRLAIWAGLHAYPECCGITILSQPDFGWEFKGSQRKPQWPDDPVSVVTCEGEMPVDYSKHVVRCGVYNSVKELKKGITSGLGENIGSKGAYLISDYADGKGQLWPFCNILMPRAQFSLESAANFRNGNTSARLGTWIARNLRVAENKANESITGIKAFDRAPASITDMFMGGW